MDWPLKKICISRNNHDMMITTNDISTLFGSARTEARPRRRGAWQHSIAYMVSIVTGFAAWSSAARSGRSSWSSFFFYLRWSGCSYALIILKPISLLIRKGQSMSWMPWRNRPQSTRNREDAVIEQLDLSLVNWARAQFAPDRHVSLVFVPLTWPFFPARLFWDPLCKDGNEEWKRITRFWMTLFAINFAIGVATGIILEFQFGTTGPIIPGW